MKIGAPPPRIKLPKGGQRLAGPGKLHREGEELEEAPVPGREPALPVEHRHAAADIVEGGLQMGRLQAEGLLGQAQAPLPAEDEGGGRQESDDDQDRRADGHEEDPALPLPRALQPGGGERALLLDQPSQAVADILHRRQADIGLDDLPRRFEALLLGCLDGLGQLAELFVDRALDGLQSLQAERIARQQPLQRVEHVRNGGQGPVVGRQILLVLRQDIAALAGFRRLDLGIEGLGRADGLKGVDQALALGVRFRREAEGQDAADGKEQDDEDQSCEKRLLQQPHLLRAPANQVPRLRRKAACAKKQGNVAAEHLPDPLGSHAQ